MLGAFKLAAIDLDDTLLGSDKSMSTANLEVVNTLLNGGIKVVLASGRTLPSMLPYHRKLGLHGPMVTTNGAFVKDPDQTDRLLSIPLPTTQSQQVIREGLDRSLAVICCTEACIYASESSNWIELYQSRTGRRDVSFALPQNIAEEEILKIIWTSDPDRIAGAFPMAKGLFGDSLNYMVTELEYLEFMASQADKWVGLREVADYYGVSQLETLAFGDNNNDVGMLGWAGLGVAMDHATLTAKQAAKVVGYSGDDRSAALARALAAALDYLRAR
jgi:Cof subfamily protein (haloacid dehalogenase superfamily)